jgi:nucleotide-binding universal stress UspA family protein
VIFASVLCGIDFTEQSAVALRLAAAVARHEGGRLTVVSVLHPLLVEAAAVTYAPNYLANETRSELKQFVATALGRAAGEPPRLLTAIGEPADEILRLAADERHDLVVVGTHGLTGYKKLFFGSTTQRILRTTTINVLVVPTAGRPAPPAEGAPFGPGPIVAALDLGAGAERIASIASRIAGTYQSPLTLLHVALERPAEDRSGRLEAARQELDRLAASVQAPGAQRMVAAGQPAEEIVHVSVDEGASLIVLGISGSHPRLTHRPGSTAYGVLCRTAVPVLAVSNP